MTTTLVLVFAVSLGLCAYVYFGYPALIFVLSRLRPRPVKRGAIQPSVTIVVPVHNEQEVIETKIRNSLDQDYPRDLLEVLVVSDGSTDATDDIVRRYVDDTVRLIRRPRQGKVAALNDAAVLATGHILVLTDANSLLEHDAVARLVESFADPQVGAVCGNKKIRPRAEGDTTQGGEGLYWRYDKWQKGLESAIGSIFAADGTLYALRRTLFVPIADHAQADDIAISTRVVLQGYRLVFDESAVAWEEAPAEGRAEFKRKVRVTNHSVRALLALGRRLWLSGFYSVELVSHKLLRHLVPFFLLVLALSNAALALTEPAFRVLLALQLLFYASASLGFALRRRSAGRSKLLTVPYYFCLVNAAALLGVLSIARGARLATWTPRAGAAAVVLLALMWPAAPAAADWLVTRDNRRVETWGRWNVDGDRVRYAVVDRSTGQVDFGSVPLAEVDMARSQAETAAQAPKPAVPTASSGAFLEGWEDWALQGPRKPRSAELRLQVGGERWDNLMQAPHERPHEDASAARSDARLTMRLLPRAPLKTFIEAGHVRYDARPASTAYGAGVGFDGSRHNVHLAARVDRNRPAADIGDATDAENDIVHARLRYALRTRRLEWWLGGDRSEQRFAAMPTRNSRQHGIQTGILYRGLGPKIAPELSLGWARLTAAIDSEDYGQGRVMVGLRYTPARFAAFNTRFEHTARSYGVADPKARNFEREDVRQRWSLGGQLRLTRHAAWTVLYERVRGESSRAGRDFTASNISTGITVRLGSTAVSPDKTIRGPRHRTPPAR